MLPRDHGVEIPPNDPKSQYACRDFPIQGGGAHHNKYMIDFYAHTCFEFITALLLKMRFSMLKLDFGVHLHPRNLASTSMLANFKLQC